MNEILIRKANFNDLDAIKKIVDKHRLELGFVMRAIIEKAIRDAEIFVAEYSQEIIGFAQYHHRRDGQTTLYNIAVLPDSRNIGIGKRLFGAVLDESKLRKQKIIALKCPLELDANQFYFHLGMQCILTEKGKIRQLQVWRKRIDV